MEVKELFAASGKDMKSDGVDALEGASKQAAIELFDTLKKYGVFVVRVGELENWLQGLQVPGKKTQWTVAMLNRLGGDPKGSDYVHPSSGDVWEFIRQIISWVKDPARVGMP